MTENISMIIISIFNFTVLSREMCLQFKLTEFSKFIIIFIYKYENDRYTNDNGKIYHVNEQLHMNFNYINYIFVNNIICTPNGVVYFN